MSDPIARQNDPCESVRLLHEQAEFLLRDEIAYAANLRDNRRTVSTLLALVVGIGVFKVDFFRPSTHTLVLDETWFLLIRVLFLGAVLLVLVGAYFIYTERPIVRDLGASTSRPGGALAVLFLREEILDQFVARPADEVWRMKTGGLRLAYTRLRDANRRVRRRLALGTMLGLLGLGLALVGFGVYTLTVR